MPANEIEIYYFSGTGNSLHIAEELKKGIPQAKLIPIAGLLNKEAIRANGATVGFVFPIHGMTVAIPVKKFLTKLDLGRSEYIFAIATRGGTAHKAFVVIDKILEKAGKSLDSYFTLNMADNDPKLKDWHALAKEEMTELESEIQNRLNSIRGTVINREKNREKDIPLSSLDKDFSPPVAWVLDHLIALGMRYAEYDGAKN